MSQAAIGDTVRVHYTGTLENGQTFDSSRDRAPLEVTLGQKQLIPGFEAALVGMAVGDTKTVNIAAEDAYGPRRDELVHDVPRDRIPTEIELEIGGQLSASTPDGGQITLLIVDFDDEKVRLDANHPLSGQNLIFDIEMVSISA